MSEWGIGQNLLSIARELIMKISPAKICDVIKQNESELANIDL